MAALGEGVTVGPGELAVTQGYVTRFGQRHDGAAAEPERAGGAADDEPLQPAPRARGIDVQIQAIAIAVAPGLRNGSDERGGERVVRVPAAGLGASRLASRLHPHHILPTIYIRNKAKVVGTCLSGDETGRPFKKGISRDYRWLMLGTLRKAKVGGYPLRHSVLRQLIENKESIS